MAVIIAVASVTTIGFFTDRVHRALDRQANQLLGADLVVAADRPLAPEFETEAVRRGLAVARVMRFPSMAVRGDRNVLSSVKVVTAGYPLRGEVRITDRLYAPDHRAGSIPAPGTVWVDERLFTQLELQPGDSDQSGRRKVQGGGNPDPGPGQRNRIHQRRPGHYSERGRYRGNRPGADRQPYRLSSADRG